MSAFIVEASHIQHTGSLSQSPAFIEDICSVSPNTTRNQREEAHIWRIPFITVWQSQMAHAFPVPDHVIGLLSPSPLERDCLGV